MYSGQFTVKASYEQTWNIYFVITGRHGNKDYGLAHHKHSSDHGRYHHGGGGGGGGGVTMFTIKSTQRLNMKASRCVSMLGS